MDLEASVKVHIVDGTFELFRAFYARSFGRDEDDDSSKAVRGLARSLLALLSERDVTHVAIAFDHEIESFRNDLFAGYKRGDGIDPVLYAQFEPAEALCRALGVVTWPMVEFEADDALASAAKRYSADVGQVVLCSPDKDLAQCVRGTDVVCLDRMRRRVLDEPGVAGKFGVGPRSIPDWLALVGDQADGIPGVPRWGAKSASAVLARYEKLEAIPARAEDWDVAVRGAKGLAAALDAAREAALLYRRLARLRTDVPIDEPLVALRWQGPDEALLDAWPVRADADTWRTRARTLARQKV